LALFFCSFLWGDESVSYDEQGLTEVFVRGMAALFLGFFIILVYNNHGEKPCGHQIINVAEWFRQLCRKQSSRKGLRVQVPS
jgi:hypothetical protein